MVGFETYTKHSQIGAEKNCHRGAMIDEPVEHAYERFHIQWMQSLWWARQTQRARVPGCGTSRWLA